MKKFAAIAAVCALVVCMTALAGCACSSTATSSSASGSSASSMSASDTSASSSAAASSSASASSASVSASSVAASSTSASASSAAASSAAASSSSAASETVTVPNVIGSEKGEAESTLKAAGFVVTFTGDADGIVIGQSLAAGATVNKGAAITLGIQAPEEPAGQNPIMNFIGKYFADRASVTVEPSGDTGAMVVVEWGSSATETTQWLMEGEFDANTLTVKYTGGKKVNIVYGEDGEVDTYTQEYDNGTGTITFKDGSPITLTWADDIENVANGMTFELV